MNRIAPLCVLLAATLMHPVSAARREPVAWERFAARYTGGYAIVAPTERRDGPGKITMKVPRGGESARLQWTNTFYSERGSFTRSVRWQFVRQGACTLSFFDPLIGRVAAVGQVTASKPRLIKFVATGSGNEQDFTVRGEARIIGGGTLAINTTLTFRDGTVYTYSFNGGRLR